MIELILSWFTKKEPAPYSYRLDKAIRATVSEFSDEYDCSDELVISELNANLKKITLLYERSINEACRHEVVSFIHGDKFIIQECRCCGEVIGLYDSAEKVIDDIKLNDAEKLQFELEALLKKHNASIDFDRDEGITVSIGDTRSFTFWRLPDE